MVKRAVVLALICPLAGLAQEMPRQGQPLVLDLRAGSPVRVPLHLPAGSYIAGEIAGDVTGLDADLLDEAGVHVRELADGAAGGVDFRILTQSRGMVLQLSGQGRAQLLLTTIAPPEAQVPPPPEYLSPRIAALADALEDGAGTAGFWAEVARTGTPLVEPTGDGAAILTFLWRGAARNVRLWGGPGNDHDWLARLGVSDVWFASYRVPMDTRLSYRLAPDVPELSGDARSRRVALMATAQVDPLNRAPWPADAPDRFNQSSTVTLPDAPRQPGTPPAPEADPTITSFAYDSALLGNQREITIARPKGMNPSDPDLVTLLLFDGEDAIRKLDAPRVIDTLTRQGALPPVLTVMIPSLDADTRARELPDNDRFADALADELLPLIAARTGIDPVPARTVVAGVSYGGLAAASVPLRRPEVFGNALSMSGSFWYGHDRDPDGGLPDMAARYASKPKLPIRFFISAGTFEGPRPAAPGIIDTASTLRDILRLKGYAVSWREYSGGHDYLVWRGALADGLIALFGR